jgi:hypothetical protein
VGPNAKMEWLETVKLTDKEINEYYNRTIDDLCDICGHSKGNHTVTFNPYQHSIPCVQCIGEKRNHTFGDFDDLIAKMRREKRNESK